MTAPTSGVWRWLTRMSRLHRWVADGDYAWPRFATFIVIRLVELALLLILLRLEIRWGFGV